MLIADRRVLRAYRLLLAEALAESSSSQNSFCCLKKGPEAIRPDSRKRSELVKLAHWPTFSLESRVDQLPKLPLVPPHCPNGAER